MLEQTVEGDVTVVDEHFYGLGVWNHALLLEIEG